MKKTGLLYLNLGTPRSPSPHDVGSYLREFLMDPYVIDWPAPFRALLVHGVIVPFRVRKSADAYRKIWRGDGSPLLKNSLEFVEKLRHALGDETPIALGMRYGSPTVAEGIKRLLDAGVTDLKIFPAYPQYALSSTETGFAAVRNALKGEVKNPTARVLTSYESQRDFISAYAHNIREAAARFAPDFYLFSYHGLPLRHLKKLDADCRGDICSLQDSTGNGKCYRRQCFKTTKALVLELGLKESQYALGFQSRLNDRWIKPYSDTFYFGLPKKGVKRLLVACPSFTADCLETLEEVGIRAREDFIRSGGDDLALVPCLNSSDDWVSAAKKMIGDESIWENL